MDTKNFHSKRQSRAATPHQLIGMAYDLTILACRRGDAARSRAAVLLLREVMHSVGPEDSSDLMTCYDMCLERIGRGEFAQAEQTLSELRKAWEAAERLFPG